MLSSIFLSMLLLIGCPSYDLAQHPGPQPVRAVGGHWVPHFQGAIAGDWLLLHGNDTITLAGRGYFRVRLEVEHWKKIGVIEPLRFVGSRGRIIHVASGGGITLTDPFPGRRRETLLGTPDRHSELEKPSEQRWRNEYFYLDGEVTLTLHEGGGLAATNYGISPVTRGQILEDVTHKYDPEKLWLRPGVIRDCR
ncbi:MAG TPA: hypothetical protein VHL34_19495 [Rhizomicrobium sp.]|jgi:hypothetical protein|nr:hypothetical protein [Rhizomicrobium sp.]